MLVNTETLLNNLGLETEEYKLCFFYFHYIKNVNDKEEIEYISEGT